MNAVRHVLQRRSLLGLGTALVLSAAQQAWAVTPAYGWGCSYDGSTLAEGGEPEALRSNLQLLGGDCGGGSVESHGTVYGSAWTGDAYFDYSFAQGARTTAAASAGLGLLHAFSASSATSTPMNFVYTANSGDSVSIDNAYRGYGSSVASSSWFDEITVQQGADYGRVVLRFSLVLNGSSSVTPGSAGAAGIAARFVVDDDRNAFDRTLSLNAAGSTSDAAGFWLGTVIRLYGDLSAQTAVRAGGKVPLPNGIWVIGSYLPSAEATANAQNTAGFLVEVLTEGASYTSASGRSYVTMVPEPASAWLLGLGGLAMLGVARRRC